MIVLVCGGRDYKDRDTLNDVLSQIHREKGITTLIHGAARGADALAGAWAFDMGIWCEAYEADWARHSSAAGPIRNQRMLDEGRPNLVVAFPGGRGTLDMVTRAREAGIEVIEIKP